MNKRLIRLLSALAMAPLLYSGAALAGGSRWARAVGAVAGAGRS